MCIYKEEVLLNLILVDLIILLFFLLLLEGTVYSEKKVPEALGV